MNGPNEASSNFLDQRFAMNSKLVSAAKEVRIDWSTLRTLIQEKGEPFWGSIENPAWSEWVPNAWCTCQECPQPLRNYSYPSWNHHEQQYFTKKVFTVRCRECNRLTARSRRKKEKAKRLMVVDEAGILKNDLKFVTLTIPNLEFKDLDVEIKKLKTRVRKFCKKSTKISGGYNFFEWTIHADDAPWDYPLKYNLHHHGIWLMQYYDQKKLQEDWGYRVDIRSVSRSSWGSLNKEQLVKYVTKYSNKADSLGKRLSESFGCLRGAAYRAIEESAQQLKGES